MVAGIGTGGWIRWFPSGFRWVSVGCSPEKGRGQVFGDLPVKTMPATSIFFDSNHPSPSISPLCHSVCTRACVLIYFIVSVWSMAPVCVLVYVVLLLFLVNGEDEC